MEGLALSTRDIHVLQKIKDPESDPTAGVSIDPSLPGDPNIKSQSEYLRISQREKEIVSSIQQVDLRLVRSRPDSRLDPAAEYLEALGRLDRLIDETPDYASARNNRAQVLRRLYGDSILAAGTPPGPHALLREVEDSDKQRAATALLTDLDRTISLLSPAAQGSLSPRAARTLSMAYTQRAAIYHATSKLLSTTSLSLDGARPEAEWGQLEFEEAASRDFAMGGRYGNDIAKGLAVSTNPTAKLCGQIVRQAMKKEYGTAFTA